MPNYYQKENQPKQFSVQWDRGGRPHVYIHYEQLTGNPRSNFLKMPRKTTERKGDENVAIESKQDQSSCIVSWFMFPPPFNQDFLTILQQYVFWSISDWNPTSEYVFINIHEYLYAYFVYPNDCIIILNKVMRVISFYVQNIHTRFT